MKNREWLNKIVLITSVMADYPYLMNEYAVQLPRRPLIIW